MGEFPSISSSASIPSMYKVDFGEGRSFESLLGSTSSVNGSHVSPG